MCVWCIYVYGCLHVQWPQVAQGDIRGHALLLFRSVLGIQTDIPMLTWQVSRPKPL